MGVNYEYYFSIRQSPPSDRLNKDKTLGEIHSSMNDILSTNCFNQYEVLIGTDMYREKALLNFTKEIDCVLRYKRMKEAVYNSSARELLTEMNTVTTGDYITHQDKDVPTDVRTYIVRNMTDRKINYDSHFILICQYDLKWVDEDGVIHTYPAHFIDNKAMLMEEQTQVLNTPADIQQCLIKQDEHTRLISNGMRFISNGETFKVVGTNRQTTKNLLELRLQKTSKSKYDNEELGIADYYKHFNKEISSSEDDAKTLEIQGRDIIYVGFDEQYRLSVDNDDVIKWTILDASDLLKKNIVINTVENSDVILGVSNNHRLIGETFTLRATIVNKKDYVEKNILVKSAF